MTQSLVTPSRGGLYDALVGTSELVGGEIFASKLL